MAIITYNIDHTSLRERSCKSTIMILSHTDADGVVSALVNKLFARYYTKELSPNVLTLGATAPGSATTMSMFKFGLSVCMNNYGKGFSNDELIIVVCDRDFFTVKDYQYIKDNYGKYTKRLRFICMDHHATNILINGEYDEILKTSQDIQMNIKTDNMSAGCSLSLEFWRELVEKYSGVAERHNDNNISFEDVEKLVECTRNWDTFIWRDMNKADQEHALQINAMNGVFGPKLMFTNLLSSAMNLVNSEFIDIFDSIKQLRILAKDINEQKIQTSIDNNLWQMKTEVANLGNDVIKFGILFGVDVEVQSMFAQKVFEMDKYYDLDVIAFINYYGTVSVRIREGRETVINGSELGKFAEKMFGTSGGGHANACGFTIDYNDVRKTELGQKTLDALYGVLGMPAPEFKLETK